MDPERQSSSRVPVRAWEIALAVFCGLSVVGVATVQHVVVLGVAFSKLHPQYYVLPCVVGTVFGALIARVIAYRRAEARAFRQLVEREAEIVHLNETLEATVEKRTHQLRAAEAELIQAQKMDAVGKLATGIVHDLNNLLTAIQGAASLARDTLADDEARELVQDVEDAAERAAALTSRLLVFSRNHAPEPRKVNLAEICEGVLPLLRRLVGRSYDIELCRTDSVPDVVVDPRRVEQVLLNLVTNARDAMPNGGKIEISAKQVARAASPEASALPGEMIAELSVRDYGAGMDQETCDRIFEPFFTTKPAGKGTGLGMVIVKRVVEESRGVLKVDSVPGEGTRISMFLPRANDTSSSAA